MRSAIRSLGLVAAPRWRATLSTKAVTGLEAWLPLNDREILARLNVFASQKDGIAQVMTLREEAMKSLGSSQQTSMGAENKAALQKIDTILKHWLGGVFCAASIDTKRVTWSTSTGETLEKVADRDMVLQKVRSIQQLKRRLDHGRRCVAIFHIGMPSDPLAFVHVALMRELARSLKFLSANASEDEPPTHAMFYSVNSLHDALSGLDMAARVIKCAALEVKKEFPSIHTFSTLSPIPRFVKWLGVAAAGKASEGLDIPMRHRQSLATATSQPADCNQQILLQQLHILIASGDWVRQPALEHLLREPLTWLVTHYLVNEKSRGGQPLDPVARFHLRNGSMVHRVNWMGNESTAGMQESAGFMVNYLYEFEKREDRIVSFARTGAFDVSPRVLELLKASPPSRFVI